MQSHRSEFSIDGHSDSNRRVMDGLENAQSLVTMLIGEDEVFATNAESHSVEKARILIVDDEPINIKVIQKYLQEFGYNNLRGISDPTYVLENIGKEPPDLVLLDLMMPQVSGYDILSKIRSDERTSHLPVLILTASCDRSNRLKALELGASDFLGKPIDSSELAPRVRNVLSAKKYADRLRDQTQLLENAIRQRTAALELSHKEIVHCLARAAEFRDNDTGHHVLRVGRYAGIIARALGLPESSIDMLEMAAQLHDVGKIGIPDSILQKPGKLEPDQYEMMQKHVCFGKKIIEPLPESEYESLKHHAQIGLRILEMSRSPLLQLASKIALTHHEKWDGSGYPLGLAGEDIPLEGRITAVADVFDALSSRRPYKPAFPLDRCFSIVLNESGKHFDPQIVEAFISQRPAIADIQIKYADL